MALALLYHWFCFPAHRPTKQEREAEGEGGEEREEEEEEEEEEGRHPPC